MPPVHLNPAQQAQMQACVNDADNNFTAAAGLAALGGGAAPPVNLRWRVRREGTNELALFVGAVGMNDDYQYLISLHGGAVPASTHNAPTVVPANQWVLWAGAIPATVAVP